MTNEKLNDDFFNPNDKYIVYKRKFDFIHGTNHAKQKIVVTEKPNPQIKLYYTQQTETDVQPEPEPLQLITYNNDTQRTVIGDYNDNNVMIKKSFTHLNALKRSMSLMKQSNSEFEKLKHENILLNELLHLELSLRTIQKNMKQ